MGRREPRVAGRRRERREPDEGLREVPLGPWLDGTVPEIATRVGLRRSDGLRLLYPGREHLAYGETESGKSMIAVLCAVAEIAQGHDVGYVHFEEDDPADTIARLRAFGADDDDIETYLHYYAPTGPLTADDMTTIMKLRPSLVIGDGYNEALALHQLRINDADAIAAFRHRFCRPVTAGGAAVLMTDHVPKADGSGGNHAIGSVHKSNGLTGASFLVINKVPFGFGRRGHSHLYVAKDRPGTLRRSGGAPRKGSGKRYYFGTLIIDATGAETEATLTYTADAPDAPNGEEVESGRVPGTTERMAEMIRKMDELGLPDTVGFKAASGALAAEYGRVGNSDHLRRALKQRQARGQAGGVSTGQG
jgi:hypothetical protein